MINLKQEFQNNKRIFSLLIPLIFFSAGLLGCDNADQEIGEEQQTGMSADENSLFAFVDVNVLPMTEEIVLENQTVIIDDGEIITVGSADDVEIPEGAEEIDGSGKYLMPGLAEMHGHIPGDDNPQYAEDVLFLYISNGVTLVRNMAGHPSHLELRDRLESGDLAGPTIYAASPWLSGGSVSSPEEASEVVQGYKEQGYDHMKMGGGMPLETYEAVAEASREEDLPFAGHVPLEVGLVNALEQGQISIDHYDRYVEFLVADDAGWDGENPGFFGSAVVHMIDEDKISEAIEMTIDAGTWNVPTLSLVEHLASEETPENMAQWPEMKYLPENVIQGWVNAKHDYSEREDFQPEATERLVEIRQILTRQLFNSGANVVLGSDAPQFFNVPGFSIHHEMEMMVAAGLSPYEVLVTGTVNPAIYYEATDEFGTVQEGQRADLILIDANPFENIANVQKRSGVMVRGVWWPEDEIQAELSEIEQRISNN